MSKTKDVAFIQNKREKIRAIAAGGAAIALSFVLSRITVFRLPQGGSITPASMLPLILYAVAFGPRYGFAACFLMSLLQLIGGYILFPLQIVLDYILPYTFFGIVGFIHSNESQPHTMLARIGKSSFSRIIIVTIAAFSMQLLCSTLSGVIFYAEYAGTQNVWVYSVTYNASFIVPECVITIVLMSAVFALARKAK